MAEENLYGGSRVDIPETDEIKPRTMPEHETSTTTNSSSAATTPNSPVHFSRGSEGGSDDNGDTSS